MLPADDFNTAAADMQKPKPGALANIMHQRKSADFWIESHAFVEKYCLEAIKNKLERGADVNDSDGWCNTVLMLATKLGFSEITAFLIGKGANVDEEDMCEGTALSWAVRHSRADIVSQLIEAGANLDYANRYDHSSAVEGRPIADRPAADREIEELLAAGLIRQLARIAAEKEITRQAAAAQTRDQLRDRVPKLTIRPAGGPDVRR